MTAGGDSERPGLKEVAEALGAVSRPASTKLAILRALTRRRMTAAEVGRAVGIHRSGAHRHLGALADAGLVRRVESHRKWVYFAITGKGRLAVRLGSTVFAVAVAASAAAAAGVTLWRWLRSPPAQKSIDAVPPPPAPFPSTTLLTIALVALALLGLFAWSRTRLAKRPPP